MKKNKKIDIFSFWHRNKKKTQNKKTAKPANDRRPKNVHTDIISKLHTFVESVKQWKHIEVNKYPSVYDCVILIYFMLDILH